MRDFIGRVRALPQRISGKLLFIVLVPLAVQLLTVGLAGWMNSVTFSAVLRSRQSTNALTAAADLFTTLVNAQAGMRGYVLTGNRRFKETYRAAQSTFEVRLAHLNLATAPDFEAQSERRDVTDAARQSLRLIERYVDLADHGRGTLARKEIAAAAGERAMDTFRAAILRYEATQLRALDAARENVMSLPARSSALHFAAAIASVIITLTLYFTISRRLSQRLSRLEQNATAFLDGYLPADADLQNDEIGQVDEALRKMYHELGERQQQLARESSLKAAILDSTNYVIITTGIDNVITSFNRGAEQMLGYRAADVIGKLRPEHFHAEELFAGSNVDPREKSVNVAAALEQSVERGAKEHEWDLVRADGSHVPVISTLTALRDGRNSISGYLRVSRDVSERRKAESSLRASEERFRQIEKHAPIGLALVALDGAFTRVNPALSLLTGYGEEELLAVDRNLIVKSDDRAVYLEQIGRLLNGTLEAFDMEARFIHKDGHAVWSQVNASVVRDEFGNALYVIEQIQDISERKAADLEIKAAQKLALSAADAKSRFLATMSHELRTPMNGIIGMAELLSLSKLTDEQVEYVEVVQESGRSLLRVLNDILDYSKLEAGKLAVEEIEFNLSGQIASVIALLEPQFKAKGVSLAMNVAADAPLRLKGDSGRIRQILLNLVGNALKFTPAGGNVRILVFSRPKKHDAMTIRFEIVDSGVGIPVQERHRLFQPFSQVDGSTTRKYGGTGLGLFICKQLIALMGGEIGVESAPGSGSLFWFTLPLHAGLEAAPAPDAAAGRSGDRRANARTRAEKLLLAEDNTVNALLAKKQFKLLGFDLTIVPDGIAAVDAVRSTPFDLVFMDCHMPRMDGLEATREIRNLPSGIQRRVPIVAMTADAQAEDQEACLAAGMDDYISKPVSLADLRTMLGRWLPSGYADVVPA